MSEAYTKKQIYNLGKICGYLGQVILFAIIFLFMGCTASRIRSSADREVYKILNEKSKEVTNEKIPLEIEPYIEKESPSEPLSLTLKDALIIAARNNYDYQKMKEDVYLKALALTSQRYQYKLRYNLGGEIYWNKNGDEENLDASLNLNLIKWLAQGAQISFEIVENYLKYLTGNKDEVFQTVLNLDLLQPLFRGAGRRIAQENLLQAERDVVYQIRTFLRYQRSFSIDVAQKYFNLLNSKSNLENYWKNYLYLKETAERIEMLSSAGRIPPFQRDQAKQNEYRAYQRWLEASNSYEAALDKFKIFLGLPLETKILLDEKGLENFLKEGIPEIKVDPVQFTTLALEKRLDLITASDELEDSSRKVKLTLDKLRTKLDLKVNVESSSGEKSEPTFDLQDPSYKAELDFEFPVNKIPERNAYREALINLERKKRDLALKKDEVKLEVLNSYRDFQESFQTYKIQKESLELAEKRVESTDLLLQAGRATTRDLLEAQESYLNAKNSLSSSIVNYWVSYLKFLRDSETLQLDEKGVWKGDLYEKISGENYQK